MNKSELAWKMMRLAIADSGLPTTDFLREFQAGRIKPDANNLQRRALGA